MIADDLTIPDFLRRPVTPESVAAVTQLIEQDRNKFRARPQLRRRALTDEKATELRIKDEANRRWRSWMPTREQHVRPRLATFERLVREEFKSKVERKRGLAMLNSTEAAVPAETKESVVSATSKTKTKARSAVKGKTSAKAPAKTTARAPAATSGGVRPGSKLEAIAKLLGRKEGCTTADVLKATGWPSVSMPQQAKAAGLVLRKEKVDGITHYFATAA